MKFNNFFGKFTRTLVKVEKTMNRTTSNELLRSKKGQGQCHQDLLIYCSMIYDLKRSVDLR